MVKFKSQDGPPPLGALVGEDGQYTGAAVNG